MKSFLKVLVGVSLLGVALSAHAQIVLGSMGSWVSSNAGATFTDTETVVYQSTPGYAPLTDLTMVLPYVGPPYGLGTAVYTDNAGDTLDLVLDVSDETYAPDDLTRSIDGAWLYAGGTGSYAPSQVAFGDGTFAVSQTIEGFSGTVLVGNLYAVPEPAPYAVLGVGALGLLMRRRRSR